MTNAGKERLLEASRKLDARELTHEEWTRVLSAEASSGVSWKVVIAVALVCTSAMVYTVIGTMRGVTGSSMEECLLLNVKPAKSDVQARIMYGMCDDHFHPAR